MKNALKATLIFVVTLLLCGVLLGCESAPSSTLDEDAVRAYADPAAETTLQGLSEGNLEKYARHGNAEFKAAVTPDIFDPVAAQIESQLGSYVSIEFLRAEEVEGYVVVHYKAKYTKGEVGVRMAFDAEKLIAGQFFE